jgi:hypothetical protein
MRHATQAQRSQQNRETIFGQQNHGNTSVKGFVGKPTGEDVADLML